MAPSGLVPDKPEFSFLGWSQGFISATSSHTTSAPLGAPFLGGALVACAPEAHGAAYSIDQGSAIRLRRAARRSRKGWAE